MALSSEAFINMLLPAAMQASQRTGIIHLTKWNREALMLSELQSRFIEEYFRDVSPVAAMRRIGVPEERAAIEASSLMKDPLVAEVISVVWRAILDHVAVHGRQIYHLPKQGGEQNGMTVEVR